MTSLRVLSAMMGGVITLGAYLFIRTLIFGPSVDRSSECSALDTDFIEADAGVIARFRAGLRLRTVSYNPGQAEYSELSKLLTLIRESFPVIYSSALVTVEVVSNYSLLYTVRGSDPALQPFLLMAHLDVVPANPKFWEESPWNATTKNGFIYGRGSIDFKHGVFGILEALQFLLKRGVVPKRPFYVAFGHDEEVHGFDGAGKMAKLLKSRNVSLSFILDEGLTVMDGFIPGLSTPLAGVATSEKGYMTLRLTVDMPGGHSSMPDTESCIGVLGKAITRLEANQHPHRFGDGPEIAMFEYMADRFSFPIRIVMSNLWLFKPVVAYFLSKKPPTNALIRTTTAVTQFQAGIKENVMAQTAWATVNHRIHSADTVQGVLEYDRKIIADNRVRIEIINSHEPLPISPHGDGVFGFDTIRTSINQIWRHHNVRVAPGLMIGGTDTKHYVDLTDCIYRFSPTYMFPEDAQRFHGINERISIENYQDAINFYYHVMRNADKPDVKMPHTHSAEL